MNVKILIPSAVGEVVIALLTGVFSNTPSALVGAVRYGYPFPWLTQLIVAPEHFPWRVDPLNLLGDILVWAMITGILLLMISHLLHEKKP